MWDFSNMIYLNYLFRKQTDGLIKKNYSNGFEKKNQVLNLTKKKNMTFKKIQE